MNSNNLFNIMQIATGLALLIGLVMVFVELRQAKALSLAELTSAGYAEAMADFRTVMGENPAPVIAKACLDSENLAPEEMVVLTAYFSSRIAQISRLRVLEAVAQFGVPWQAVATQQLSGILDNKVGRTWFENNLQVDPELYAIGQKMIEDGVDCKSPLLPPYPEQVFTP